jgi:uncharacterized membrane protein YkvA (DUF1232 family)
MKFSDFKDSKYFKDAQNSEKVKKIKEVFPKWFNRIKKHKVGSYAGRIWDYFKSSKVSAKAKLYIIAALMYLISPVDVIPDFIPMVGWFDDIAVCAAILKYLDGEISKFENEEFENEEIENTDPESYKDEINKYENNEFENKFDKNITDEEFWEMIIDNETIKGWEVDSDESENEINKWKV